MSQNSTVQMNPRDTVLTVDGNIISQFGDGTYITFSDVSERVSSQAGANGDVVVSIKNDNRATLTIQLIPGDDSEKLAALRNRIPRHFVVTYSRLDGTDKVVSNITYLQNVKDVVASVEPHFDTHTFLLTLPGKTPGKFNAVS